MKNRKKYALTLLQYVHHNQLMKFIDEYVLTDGYGGEEPLNEFQKLVLLILWLDDEYIEPKIDWTKIEVDTPILVKDNSHEIYIKRYFAKYENNKIYTWSCGRTSWNETATDSWEYAKLAKEDADEE